MSEIIRLTRIRQYQPSLGETITSIGVLDGQLRDEGYTPDYATLSIEEQVVEYMTFTSAAKDNHTYLVMSLTGVKITE